MLHTEFKIREWISACAKCRSFHGPICVFCKECWRALFDLKNSQCDLKQVNYPFKVYSLFTWYDEYDKFIRPLVYSLKGGLIYEPWEWLANWFLFARQLEEFSEDLVLITPPQKTRRDHALLWAQAFSCQLRAPILSCLEEGTSTGQQKSLTRFGRFSREYLLKGDFSIESFQNKKVVLVDDTITSGGTAQAVFIAIGEPSSFEVWTLASRPRHGTY